MSGRVVPRVARSLGELRVGMVVAIHDEADGWSVHTVSEVEPPVTHGDVGTLGHFWTRDGAGGGPGFLSRYTVVILSDPPRPAYRVPAEQVDALREQMREIDRVSSAPTHPFWEKNWEDTVDKTLQAARSLLDAAEVEGDGE